MKQLFSEARDGAIQRKLFPIGKPVEASQVAVIDIGATSLRMAIGELRTDGHIHTLESLSKPIALGKDTFSKGRLSRESIEQCVDVLNDYRERMSEYQLDYKAVKIVATSAVREAENTLEFVDRIYIATGFEVEVLDDQEVHRMMYIGVQPYLQKYPFLAEGPCMLAEVGGGATELIMLDGTNVVYSHGIRLGALRLRETFDVYQAPEAKFRQLLDAHILRLLKSFRTQFDIPPNTRLLAIGGDLRFAADQLMPQRDPHQLCSIPLASLENLANRLIESSVDEIASKYHRTYPEAETIGPALLANVHIARLLSVPDIHIGEINLRNGLIRDILLPEEWSMGLRSEIERSAIEIGRKYRFDEAHATHVAKSCGELFNQLKPLHGLEFHAGQILSVAALLHEIGLFIGTSAYHKHSMYLITNSELFGMGSRDLQLVATVARYHRRASPKPSHTQYMNLDRSVRIMVAKLAALLRLALAINASRSQQVEEIQCHLDNDRLVVEIKGLNELSTEQIVMRQTCHLFEEVFGIPAELQLAPAERVETFPTE